MSKDFWRKTSQKHGFKAKGIWLKSKKNKADERHSYIINKIKFAQSINQLSLTINKAASLQISSAAYPDPVSSSVSDSAFLLKGRIRFVHECQIRVFCSRVGSGQSQPGPHPKVMVEDPDSVRFKTPACSLVSYLDFYSGVGSGQSQPGIHPKMIRAGFKNR